MIRYRKLTSPWPRQDRIREVNMGGFGEKNKPPKEKEKRPTPARLPAEPAEDDQYEDGGFATPKHDRSGSDDEPL
jgi:hypothetical protein